MLISGPPSLLEEVAASTRSLPGVDVRVSCDDGLYVSAEPDLLEQAGVLHSLERCS